MKFQFIINPSERYFAVENSSVYIKASDAIAEVKTLDILNNVI